MTDCNSQLAFPFFQPASLVAQFDGGQVVTDSGLLLVREFDERIGFTAALSRVFYDPRDPRFVRHDQRELLRQRLYQIIAGYQDANDATYLRHDPIFKAVSGRCPEDEPLASQPTLSRLENRVSFSTVLEGVDELARQFVASRPSPMEEITLDIDPSDARTYGNQQLTFFRTYYGGSIYFPQFVCDAKSRYLLAAVLRPGNVSAAEGAIRLLARLVELLRAAWPKIRISVRADSNFADPDFLTWLEEQQIRYVVGMAENDVLKRLSADFVQRVEERCEASRQPQRSFTSFRYQTQHTWPHPRRIVVKAEATPLGMNVRYIIAGCAGRSADLYTWYAERGGTIEDAIEQLKNGFSGDRMSCSRFDANAFRLVVHAAAYNLMVLFREKVVPAELKSSTIETLRIRLLKVGAVVKRTVRRVWIHLSSSWPYAQFFRQTHRIVVPAPSG